MKLKFDDTAVQLHQFATEAGKVADGALFLGNVLEGMAKRGELPDETQLRGIAGLIKGLGDSIASAELEHREYLEDIKNIADAKQEQVLKLAA